MTKDTGHIHTREADDRSFGLLFVLPTLSSCLLLLSQLCQDSRTNLQRREQGTAKSPVPSS
ncbi:hypothetical protein IF1G_06093 [Cordyceps javanica]|uniref:Uncharacterized protein n=1 Tax=Cordyceps javanica TaxID=43265 RepID=A0A545V059_9HYPO|nr:hypothetical protein IF1G_06093 [Cordyceps javanica]